MTGKLILVSGLPGSGKSTVSKLIQLRVWDSILLRTDMIRKELFSKSAYTQEESDTVYSEFYRRASGYLSLGKTVILDAVFAKQDERDRAWAVAGNLGCPIKFVYVFANEKVSKERIRQRTWDPSEATEATYDFLKEHYDPIRDDHISIDNSGSLESLECKIQNISIV